jgi:predicted dehydrogenase
MLWVQERKNRLKNLVTDLVFQNGIGDNILLMSQRYASYEDLVRDEGIDIIYIATLNHLHKEHTLLAINHRKNVLCEKPLTINAQEVIFF